MKAVAATVLLFFCSCASTQTAMRPTPADTLPSAPRAAASSKRSGTIVYEFPRPPLGIEKEASAALKHCLYTSDVFLQNGQLGSDGVYDYAFFFAGWRIETGFE